MPEEIETAENSPTLMDDKTLAALMEQRKRAQIEDITRDLVTWLNEHNVTLQSLCGFSPDGRHVSQIQVVLKAP
jgi:hypothetical protein